MLQLINTYSLSNILVFLTMIGLAVKGTVTFWDWAIDRLRKVFGKEVSANKEKEDIKSEILLLKEKIKQLEENQKESRIARKEIMDKINLLINSDKDDIKSDLTKQYHYFCNRMKWIDDYSLDCIERRYEHYLKEGGNSYVKDLIDEIRRLPKQAPKE